MYNNLIPIYELQPLHKSVTYSIVSNLEYFPTVCRYTNALATEYQYLPLLASFAL